MTDCMVCLKHQDLKKFTGKSVGELGGWLMTHFPVLDGVAATKGHLLIETQRHIQSFNDLSDEEAVSLGLLVREGTKWIQDKFQAEHVYMFRINDKVAHLHVHLIPRYAETPAEFWGLQIMNYAAAPKIGLHEIQRICGG